MHFSAFLFRWRQFYSFTQSLLLYWCKPGKSGAEAMPVDINHCDIAPAFFMLDDLLFVKVDMKLVLHQSLLVCGRLYSAVCIVVSVSLFTRLL